jgi:hypothetical protein
VRALCVLAGVFVGAQVAWADLPSGGTVYIKLGYVDMVKWVKPDHTIVTQFIKDKRDLTGSSKDACALALGQPELLTITSPQGKTVGFNKQKNWIGIRDQSKGVDCGRLVPGQTIKLALGSYLPPNVVVRSTELQVNAKKNAVIRAVVSANGQTQTFKLRTGLSATGQPGPNEQFCFPGRSDSNPDSSANCTWKFNGSWDEVTFFTDVGEWSIADGFSKFELIEFTGVLGCDPANRDVVEIAGPDGLTSSGFRLGNVDDPLVPGPAPECVVVPYVYEAECPEGLTLPPDPVCTNFVYDPLNQGTNMTFFFQWNWPAEEVPASGGIDAIPETLQFFLNGAPVGVELDICPEIRPQFDDNGTADDPTDDVFTGIDPAFPPADQEPTVPGTQAGCLITREVIQNGEQIRLIEGAYVQGDYVGSRSVGFR